MKENKHRSFLSNQEKALLKEQIMQSARCVKNKGRNKHIIFSVAASIALLIGFSLIFYNSIDPSIEDFVKNAPEVDIKQVDSITLILNESSINLDEKKSKIHYSTSGKNISIGSEKIVTQESTINNKPIFNTLIVPYGKRTNLKLSDGTTVLLNSGSKLTYPAVFKGNFRTVFLDGEAIFDVTHNEERPFKVISESQEIEVLGTVFNVSHYSDDVIMNTVLKSGSIRLTYKDSEKKDLKLTPGMLASYNTNTFKVNSKQVSVNDYFSWKDGYLTLKSSSLKYIMTKLSRYYNVDIIIENKELAAQTFSGKLDLKENVEKVLKLIKETTDFEMDFHDGKIALTNLELTKNNSLMKKQ